jgi:hypothetical protein
MNLTQAINEADVNALASILSRNASCSRLQSLINQQALGHGTPLIQGGLTLNGEAIGSEDAFEYIKDKLETNPNFLKQKDGHPEIGDVSWEVYLKDLLFDLAATQPKELDKNGKEVD